MFPRWVLSRREPGRPWKPKTARDLETITIRARSFDFHERFDGSAEESLQYYHSKLFLRTETLIGEVLGGDGKLTGKQSPWVHQYPDEFYEHVKAIARPDPKAKHWEGLLRNEDERTLLITAIIIRVLDAEIFSSLMFGASDKHEKALHAHDIDLLKCDGFERSKLLAQMNEAYLHETDGVPPFLSERVTRIVSQIASMLLPLYNVIGSRSESGIPTLEDFCQGLNDIVSYAAWLGVMTRLLPGITTLTWLTPGDEYELEQFNALHDVFENSRAKSRKYDMRYSGEQLRRTGRIKISAFPKILYYPPPTPGTGDKKWHHGYKVSKPHAVYYYGLSDPREDAETLFPLPDYILRVRKPRGIPPAILVWLIAIIIALCFHYLVAGYLSIRREGYIRQ